MSSIFLMILFILSLLYIVLKFRITLKNLNAGTLVGVSLLFIICVGGAGVFLYYLGEWSSDLFENSFALVFSQFLSFLIVVSICLAIFHTVLSKLSPTSEKQET